MDRVYEIFEVLSDGSPHKVTVVSELEFARMVLESLASRTKNECFAADAKTRRVVMQKNVQPARLRRIFQISYDEELGVRRAELLRSHGYGVISEISNDSARLLLSSPHRYDPFIIGRVQHLQRREEKWLIGSKPNTQR